MTLTWIRPAAGFRLFSKCFCRCCSCTFRANPEPKMPWGTEHQIATSRGIVKVPLKNCGQFSLQRFFPGSFFDSNIEEGRSPHPSSSGGHSPRDNRLCRHSLELQIFPNYLQPTAKIQKNPIVLAFSRLSPQESRSCNALKCTATVTGGIC